MWEQSIKVALVQVVYVEKRIRCQESVKDILTTEIRIVNRFNGYENVQ
jgi:hypothetical protein